MEEEKVMPKTYNPKPKGYEVPAKGVDGVNPLRNEPDQLTGDKGLDGIPDALPNENPDTLLQQAERVFDKI